MKNKILLLSIIIIGIVLNSCEDPAPFDYEKEYYVESYLTVDEPINHVKIFQSLPLDEPYSIDAAVIKDAEVFISRENEIFELQYSDEPSPGYYYDENYLVLPNTKYDLRIELKSGEVFTGTTVTPERFNWARPLVDTIYYPENTAKLPPAPDSTRLFWERAGDKNFYLINVKCHDTLDYGSYFNPPLDIKNRRVDLPFDDVNQLYKDLTTINLIANTESPIVWFAFRWYGPHEIIVQAPDNNYLKWYLQFITPEGDVYNPLLTTLEGGAMGVFGSVSEIKDYSFLKMNGVH